MQLVDLRQNGKNCFCIIHSRNESFEKKNSQDWEKSAKTKPPQIKGKLS